MHNKPLAIELDTSRSHNQYQVEHLPNVYFPCQPYPQQIAIAKTIHQALEQGKNALIDSPTGTGKTLSLLVGVLSYYSFTNLPCKLYYLTRTHSQINQVIAELKRTCYRFQTTVITARESMCINQSLQQVKGRELDRRCES